MSDEPIAALPPSPTSSAAQPVPAKPVSKLRWGIHLALMASLPLVAGFAGSASRNAGPALTSSVKGLLTVCGFEVLFVAIPLALAWLASRATIDDLLLRWRPGFWVLPLGALYSVAIRIATGMVVAIVAVIAVVATKSTAADVQNFIEAHRPQVEKLVDIDAMSANPAYFWLAVVVVSLVVGGLREELWRSSFLAGLRSIWPRAFASQGGGVAGAAVAALFFGAGHYPQGMLAVGMITIVGFLLGLIMVLHRSVWPSVVAHGLFDATSMALLPWVAQYLHELQKAPHAGG